VLSTVSRILFASTVRGLVSDLKSPWLERLRYRVGKRFQGAIRDRHLSGLEHYPMYPVWSDFALSTNLRGKAVVRRLQRYTGLRGKRCLDVGCAYGGYPIAFAAEGADAVGIDINARFLELAAENVRDQGATVLLLERDVTKSDQISDLGRFDIITCNDLIEHVDDVAATFRNIASLLRPGGLLFMEIPNARSVGQILKDGHYGLFGITLLSRPDAIRYFNESGYDGEYGVGYFHRLEEYAAFLDRQGIHLYGGTITNTCAQPDERVERVRNALPAIHSALQDHLGREGLSPATKAALSLAVEDFLREAGAGLAAYETMADAGRRRTLAEGLVRSYDIEFWELIGVKEADPSS
jgi:SAM-dependent methyltransferase